MGQELAIAGTGKYDRKHDGKALSSLPEQHRAFVLRLMELGPGKAAANRAAMDVGFCDKYGYELMRDERVLAAIREEATKEVVGATLIGVKRLIEIARDETHRDSYKAAKDLAGMNGFASEQRIVVEHINHDTKAQIAQIRAMAKELGLEPAQLIAAAGIKEQDVQDAEFEEIEDGGQDD